MESVLNKQNQSIGHYQPHLNSQFINKLCDILQKYPKIVKWNKKGDQVIISNIEYMESIVLPLYFRHCNFASFIRQLNIYDFHKIYRKEQQISFKNQIFFKGNQNNFYLIQRNSKNKDKNLWMVKFQQQYSSMLQKINMDNRISPILKDLLKSLLKYKFISVDTQNKMQRSLQNICEQLQNVRLKKIKTIITQLKQQTIPQIKQSRNKHHELDNLINNSLLKSTHSKQKQLRLIGQQSQIYNIVQNQKQQKSKSESISQKGKKNNIYESTNRLNNIISYHSYNSNQSLGSYISYASSVNLPISNYYDDNSNDRIKYDSNISYKNRNNKNNSNDQIFEKCSKQQFQKQQKISQQYYNQLFQSNNNNKQQQFYHDHGSSLYSKVKRANSDNLNQQAWTNAYHNQNQNNNTLLSNSIFGNVLGSYYQLNENQSQVSLNRNISPHK